MGGSESYLPVMTKNLRVTLNTLMGRDFNDEERLTPQKVKDYTLNNDCVVDEMLVHNACNVMWGATFSLKHFQDSKWGTLTPASRNELIRYTKESELTKMLQNPKAATDHFIKLLRPLSNMLHPQIFEILGLITVFGIYTKRPTLIASTVLLILESSD